MPAIWMNLLPKWCIFKLFGRQISKRHALITVKFTQQDECLYFQLQLSLFYRVVQLLF